MASGRISLIRLNRMGLIISVRRGIKFFADAYFMVLIGIDPGDCPTANRRVKFLVLVARHQQATPHPAVDLHGEFHLLGPRPLLIPRRPVVLQHARRVAHAFPEFLADVGDEG